MAKNDYSKRKFIKNKPFITLLNLYRGNYKKLLASLIFFIIKHSPVWIMPIILSNLINIVSKKSENMDYTEFYLNIFVIIFLLLTNIPMNVLCTKYMSLSIRNVESDIRIELVKKLQNLSVQFHKHLHGGKLQSKVLRDVELIINLSNQVFNAMIPIVLNILVAFSVTIIKNIYVALFFLVTIPISSILIHNFRTKVQDSNKALRKNIEEMSTTVSEMVEMVPITRAHALENVEIKRVYEKVSKVKKSGYLLVVL